MNIISLMTKTLATQLTKQIFFSKAGGISVFLIAFVVILYVIKNILMELVNTDKSNHHRKCNLLILLRRTHFGIGWIILILAIIHSIYYLLYFIEHNNFSFYYGIYSGIITFIILLIGCGFGLKYQYINNKINKRWHIIFALLLGILIIIHLNSI